MVLSLLFVVVWLIVSAVSGYSTSPYYDGKTDVPCDTASNVFVPWSGLRVQLQVVYSVPRVYAIRMTYCWRGSELGLSYGVSHLEEDEENLARWVNWRSVFCFHSDDPMVSGCYRMARRAQFSKRDTIFHVPNTFIGGIFKCVPNTPCERNHHVTPYLPLLTDEPYMTWFRPRNSSYPTQRIPLLYTPDKYSYMYPRSSFPYNWYQEIDLNEDYP